MLFSNVIKLWRRFYSVSFSLFFNLKLIMLLYRYYYKFDEETLTELKKPEFLFYSIFDLKFLRKVAISILVIHDFLIGSLRAILSEILKI
jgi:hypothetical protein